MNSFAAELKRAREDQRLTLADVADTTLINIKFLEEIERGNVSFMPRTYVRAFVRDYAKAVGLNPDEIMKMMDDPSSSVPIKPQPKKEEPALPPIVESPPSISSAKTGEVAKPKTTRVVTAVIVLLAVCAALWNLLTPSGEKPVEEKSFEEVMQEQIRADSLSKLQTAPPEESLPDTLTLVAVAKDSTSIRLTIDNAKAVRFVMPPKGRRTWKATSRFLITVGDAGDVDFSVDQKKINLGKPGTVVNNFEVSRTTLEKK